MCLQFTELVLPAEFLESTLQIYVVDKDLWQLTSATLGNHLLALSASHAAIHVKVDFFVFDLIDIQDQFELIDLILC